MKSKIELPRPNDLASFIESKGRALRADELAALFGVTRAMIYKQTREGLIPCIRISSSVRYDCFATARWLRSLTIGDPDSWTKPNKSSGQR